LAHKYLGTGGVSYTLFGDGAAPQGQVSETWNMAKLWNLPIIFLCENNKYAMGTAVHRHSANSELYTRGDLIPGIQVKLKGNQPHMFSTFRTVLLSYCIDIVI
jgi:pyruvate dehydrogenase E1 component alpha subunit